MNYGDSSYSYPSLTTTTLSHAYSSTGTYSILVTVYDNNGGEDTAEATVSVTGADGEPCTGAGQCRSRVCTYEKCGKCGQKKT